MPRNVYNIENRKLSKCLTIVSSLNEFGFTHAIDFVCVCCVVFHQRSLGLENGLNIMTKKK